MRNTDEFIKDLFSLSGFVRLVGVFCVENSRFFQSFFGFGQSADIEIHLDGADTRKTAEIKTEDGKKERFYLYYDGETVSGTVSTG